MTVQKKKQSLETIAITNLTLEGYININKYQIKLNTLVIVSMFSR